jgi:hypothetical protein
MRWLKPAFRDAEFPEWPSEYVADEMLCARKLDGIGSTKFLPS